LQEQFVVRKGWDIGLERLDIYIWQPPGEGTTDNHVPSPDLCYRGLCPYCSIRFNIDRMGNLVYVKFLSEPMLTE
jgi:hypothetical protein